MNIKDMADELRKKWQKKFGKKKVDDDDFDAADGEEKEIASSADMLNGNHGPIAGLNRKWVKGIAAGIVLLFLSAFWYVSGDDDANKANNPKQPQVKQDKNIANGKDVDTQLNGKSSTDDYQELMKHNREAAAERAAKSGSTGSSAAAASHAGTARPIPSSSGSSYSSGSSRAEASPASSSAPQTSVRPIPASASVAPSYSTPYQLPSQQAPVTTQATPVSTSPTNQVSEEEKAAKKAALDRIKQKFASAIGFSLKESGTQSDGEGAAKAVSSAAPADAASNQAASASDGSSGTPTNVHSTYTAPTSNMIMSGTVIPVMLLTGINSDAPGQVMAQVQADVYDYFGTSLLIPAGSRLMGTYDQKATNGRVNITFNTLQLTNGGTWSIGNSIVAVDGAGYMGIAGKVTHHTAKKFGAGLLKSALNALSTVGADRVTIDTSAFLHDDEQNIKDTVTVKPGYQFDVYVTNNISF